MFPRKQKKERLKIVKIGKTQHLKKTGETKMANKERTTIMIDRELLTEAQNTAARIGIPLVVAGSTSKFLRYLLQDFNAKNPKHPKKA